MSRENELNQLYEIKIKEENEWKRLMGEVISYANKMEKVFGFFQYKGYICKIRNYEIVTPLFDYDRTYLIDIRDIGINTKKELNDFKEELDKTFDIDINYSKEQLKDLIIKNGIILYDKTINKNNEGTTYRIKYDDYAISFTKFYNGEKYFGRNDRLRWCKYDNAEDLFNYENYGITLLNLIQYNKDKKKELSK